MKHRTVSQDEADFLYIPAFFPLLFWMESSILLDCVNTTLYSIDYRMMGYTVLINYGHEYPHWKRQPTLLLENYHPFAANFHVITVAYWSQGRKKALFGGKLFDLHRFTIIPYFATYNCLDREKSRHFNVCFAGSIKRDEIFGFRERILFCHAYEQHRWPSVFIQPIPPDDSYRTEFAKMAAWRSDLYAQCRYCAIMPGDGNTAQRAFDAMVQNCVPVFLYHPDSYVVLPFIDHIPWFTRVGLHYQVATVEDVSLAISALIETSHEVWLRHQEAVRWAAPRIAMELQQCSEQPNALSLMVEDLEKKRDYMRAHWPVGFGEDVWDTFKGT